MKPKCRPTIGPVSDPRVQAMLRAIVQAIIARQTRPPVPKAVTP